MCTYPVSFQYTPISRFDSPFNSSSGDGESDASYHSVENPTQRDIDISGLPANLTIQTDEDVIHASEQSAEYASTDRLLYIEY